LNRLLAAAGLGSRRHCDELIAAGRVTINGKVCTNFSAQPGARDHVKVDDKLVHTAPPLTIMLNKPAGFVSTRKDPHARDTVFELIPEKFSHLFTIGRLDAQTQGLLLLTNDGELAQRLSHPRFKVDKEYEVTLDRPWDPALALKLARGIRLDGQRAKIAQIRSLSSTRLRVILRQGINRQITGASAVIGREFARQLAGRAKSLILIARREQKLNELRDELNQRYPNVAVSVLKTDLADPAQLNELLAWLNHKGIDVDLLI